MRQKLVLRQKLKPLLVVGVTVAITAITFGIAFLLNIGNVHESFGQSGEVVWTGYENEKWNNSNNWKGGELPKDGDKVIIQASHYAPVLTGRLKLNDLVVEPEAILHFSAQANIKGNLLVESTASVLFDAGLCEVGGDVVVKNGLIRLNGGKLKCTGRLVNFGGQVSLHAKASLQVNHDFELQGENAQFNLYGGDAEIKGDLDFITDEDGGKTSVFLESGELLVESALRFYRVNENTTSMGSLTISGGLLRAATLERQGQNIDFETAVPHINMTSGALHFTSFIVFESSDHIDLQGGNIQFSNGLTSSKPLVSKSSFSFENKSTAHLKAPLEVQNLELRDKAHLEIDENLKVNGDIISNSSRSNIGNGKLLFGDVGTISISGTNRFAIANLALAPNQDLLVSCDVVIGNELELNGRLLSGPTKAKLYLERNTRVTGNQKGFACLPVVQDVERSATYPLGRESNPYFLDLKSSNALEYVEVAIEEMDGNLSSEKDMSIVEFGLPVAWKISGNTQDELKAMVNVNTNQFLLAGLTDEGWTALTTSNSQGLLEYNIPAGCEFVTLCKKPKISSGFVTVNAELVEKGVELEWALNDKSAIQYYSVKKKVGDRFVEIARIPVDLGTKYFDPETLTQNVTYRIDLVNSEGYFKKGNPVEVKMKPKQDEWHNMQVAAYPNPFSNELTLKVVTPEAQLATISVLDAGGKVHWTGSNLLVDGANTIPVNQLSSLQSGNYQVLVSTDSQTANVAIQKAH